MGTKLTSIDLEAFVDGELTPEEEAYIKAMLPNDPALNCRYKQLLEQKEMLKKWWEQR